MYIDPNTRTATYVNPLYGVAPPGYELKQNESGRLFYVNRQTGVATWHKPLAIEPLPAGWEAGQTADGRMYGYFYPRSVVIVILIWLCRYYINHVTKTNTWTKPTSPAQPVQPTVHPVRPSATATTQSAPLIAPTHHQPIQVAKPTASTNFQVRPAAQSMRSQSMVASSPMAPPSTSLQAGAMRPAPMGMVHSPQQTIQPRPSHGGTTALQAQSSLSQGVVNSVQPLTSSPASATVPLQPASQQSSPIGLDAALNQARPPLHSRVFSAPSTTSAASAGTKLQNSITAMARNPNVQNVAAGLGRFALRAALSDGNDTGDSGSTEFQSTESVTFETVDSDMSQSQDVAVNEQYMETPSLQTQDVSPNPAPPAASSDIVYAQNSTQGGQVSAPTYVYDSSCAYPTDSTSTLQGSSEYALGNSQPQYTSGSSDPQVLSPNPLPTQTYTPQPSVPVANDPGSLQTPGLSLPQYQSDNNVTYVDYTSQPSSTPQIVENNNLVINTETTPATQYQQQDPITGADIATSAAAGYVTTPYDPSTQFSSLAINDYNNAVTNATIQNAATSSTQVAPQYDQSTISPDALAASEAIAMDGQNASLALI